MKKILLTILMVAVYTAGTAQDNDGTKVKPGDKVPSFTVTMTDGSKINIEDLKGKTVLVNFWATWCPPCRAELQRVEKEIIEKFAGEDFVFLPISRGEKKETVTGFLEKNGYKFVAGLDTDNKIFPLFAESGIPRNFIVDSKGNIAATEIGYSPELFDELLKKIEKTLKTK